MALKEDRPLVPNTPTDRDALGEELRALYTSLAVGNVLIGMTEAVMRVGEESVESAAAYLLVLDAKEKTLEIRSFARDQLAQASEEYLLVEQENTNKRDVQVVLVSVDSLATLQSAYPNYYLDTTEFVLEVQSILGM